MLLQVLWREWRYNADDSSQQTVVVRKMVLVRYVSRGCLVLQKQVCLRSNKVEYIYSRVLEVCCFGTTTCQCWLVTLSE